MLTSVDVLYLATHSLLVGKLLRQLVDLRLQLGSVDGDRLCRSIRSSSGGGRHCLGSLEVLLRLGETFLERVALGLEVRLMLALFETRATHQFGGIGSSCRGGSSSGAGSLGSGEI